MEKFSSELLGLITGKFAGLNLTRITEPSEFYQKQILDSIIPYQESKVFQDSIAKNRFVIDLGFGGGFPILPMAKILPETQFVGIEATRKKVDAVNEMAKDLGLKNVKCFHMRLEDLIIDRSITMTFKAVGPISDLLSKIKTSAPIEPFFFKGPNVFELEKNCESVKGWELFEKKFIEIPGVEGRYLLGYRNVPRGTITNFDKRLVKLSELQLI